MSVIKNYKAAWEESHARGDNNILYPQTEVIRFLNRYICKRNNDKSITKLIKTTVKLMMPDTTSLMRVSL